MLFCWTWSSITLKESHWTQPWGETPRPLFLNSCLDKQYPTMSLMPLLVLCRCILTMPFCDWLQSHVMFLHRTTVSVPTSVHDSFFCFFSRNDSIFSSSTYCNWDNKINLDSSPIACSTHTKNKYYKEKSYLLIYFYFF